jgi:hypothetical protein
MSEACAGETRALLPLILTRPRLQLKTYRMEAGVWLIGNIVKVPETNVEAAREC